MRRITGAQYHSIGIGDSIEISMDNGKSIVREVVDHNGSHEPIILYRRQRITIDKTRVIGILPQHKGEQRGDANAKNAQA